MGSRALDVKVISAKHLKDVNFISKMDVYAVVSISGDSKKQKVKTPVDHDGGSHPTWNFPVKFTVDDSLARQNRLSLIFKLKSERTLGDKDIGEVVVPVKELLDTQGDGKSPKFVSYQVRTPSGKPKGELDFSYQFGNLVPASAAAYGVSSVKANEPVMAYPVSAAGSSSVPYAAPYPPPHAAGYAYPPPQQEKVGYAYPPPQEKVGYAYPPPQAAGYAYPPPPQPGYGPYPAQGGYGYPPMMQQQQQPAKKNKLGMGLGAGLLGGMLGGLLIGDIVSDVADYDAGDMDVGGGFDF